MEFQNNEIETFSEARAAGKTRYTYEKLRAELNSGDRIAYFNLESGGDVATWVDEFGRMSPSQWNTLVGPQKVVLTETVGGTLSGGFLAIIQQDAARPVAVKAKKREFNNGPASRRKWWNK